MLMFLAIVRRSARTSAKGTGTLGINTQVTHRAVVENKTAPTSEVKSFPRWLIVFCAIVLAATLLYTTHCGVGGLHVGSHAEYLAVRSKLTGTLASLRHGLALPVEVLLLGNALWLKLKIAAISFFWQADVTQEIFRLDMVPGAVDFIPVTSKRPDYFFEQILFFKLLQLQLTCANYPFAAWVEFFSVGAEFMKTQGLVYRAQFSLLLIICSAGALGFGVVAARALNFLALPFVAVLCLGYCTVLLFENTDLPAA